jgi:DNA-binding beta-propeller fold protein YncE
MRITRLIGATCVAVFTASFASRGSAQPAAAPSAQPYKVVKKAPVGGTGSFDYVFADADGRKLYVPRSNRVEVYDLDTLKSVGTIAPANGVHGAAVDPKAKHGFCSSNPVVMWDTDTLATIKTIPVQGRPDGILFDPFTQHVMILSHSAPNVTVIDTKDGSIVGTIDLGGQPEQGASDGNGKLYITLEDKSKIAVVDSKAMKVTATYDMAPKSGTPAGLALDAKNHILFASGRSPATCLAMNADDGTIIAALPIGSGVDASAFNPATMEAFVSTGDGKVTIIKETDQKTFTVEQTVTTLSGGKTCTLDAKTGQIYVIANDPSVAPAAAATQSVPPAGGRGGRGGRGASGTFSIIVIGKDAK